MKLRLVNIFLILSFWVTRSFAQTHSFITYGPNQGIGQSQVTALAQEKNGLVWIGTKGAGISVFDGKSVERIRLNEGLPDANITYLFRDGKDRIWIGTQKGLAYSVKGRIEKIIDYRLQDDEITAITEDFNGNIWIGSKRNGVSFWKNGKITSFGINDGLGFSRVTALACDSAGTVWVGSDNFGFVGYRENRFFKPSFSGDRSFQVRSFLPDTRFSILVFTNKGVFRVNNRLTQPWSLYPLSTEEQKNILFGIRDKKGNLWLSMQNNGVIRLSSSKTSSSFSTLNGLPSDKVITILESNQGNIWLGTDGGGVALYRGESMNKYGASEGLTNQQIRSIFQNDTVLLVGTENGLFELVNNKLSLIPGTEGITFLSIYNHYGQLICGTDQGVFIQEKKQSRSLPVINKGSPVEVRSIYPLNKNSLLLGTSDGVLQFDGKSIRMRYRDSLPVGLIYKINSTSKGLLFCSEWGAYIQEQSGLIKRIPLRDQYGDLDAIDAAEHSSGAIFIITGRGLAKFQNGKTTLYTEASGLPSSNLYQLGLLYDIVWLGSDKGLTKISLDKNLNLAEISNFNKQEGFEGVECNSGSMLVEPTGKVWSGTINGLYSYDPSKEKNTRRAISLFLKKVMIRYEPVSTDSFINIKALEWKNNHLTFEFSAPEFIRPNQTRFSFMLKGFEKNWSPPQQENIITYSNLPEGNYTLLSKAMSGNGIWSEPVEIKFTIQAPFWRTTWFRIIAVLLVTGLFYLLLQWRTGRLEKIRRLLEEKVRERTSELNEQKAQLEKLSIVASHMNDGVLICDANGKIEFINTGFYRMSGYSPEEYKDSPYGKALTLQELSSTENIEDLISTLSKDRKAIIYDSSHINKLGQEVWTRGSLAPILSSKDGSLEKIVAIYTDITDRKLAEQALEETNRNILDSIVYAKRIQEAILPSISVIENVFPDSFVFYQPRDIVSGDFYWFGVIRDHFIWAVADCTGHGVPGALMSMIGNEFLHQIVNNELVSGAEQVLFLLDKQITRALHQEGSMRESRDGMDIGLCVINLKSGLCQYAGANTSMYRVRKDEVEEFEGAKESIGGYKETGKEYYSHEFFLNIGDELYISTDGYLDQFGGDRNKKYMKRRFIDLIKNLSGKKAEERQSAFYDNLLEWMGENKQVDDILVVGLRNHRRFNPKIEE